MKEREIVITFNADSAGRTGETGIEVSILDRTAARENRATFPKSPEGLEAAAMFTRLWVDVLMKSFLASEVGE